MDIEDYELHERIERVETAEATENDLVTLAVPPDKPLGEVLERVEEDRAEAEYIDSDEADKALREALERVRRVLQREEATPEQGLVVYAGVVDGDLVEYVFDDLPSPVSEFRYDLDNEFDTDPLSAAEQPSKTFGLLVVERGGAALGLVENDDVQVVETIDSDVMGKTKAGGQSADRFERERQRQKKEFFQSVAEEAERAFLGEHDDESERADAAVDGLLLGGTSVTAENFREGDYLDHRLRDRIVGDSFAVEYASEQGLRELARKARDRIDDAERRAVQDALDRFFDALETGDDGGGEVVYGRDEVEQALEYDAVDTVLVSESLPVEEVRDVEERATDEGGDCVVVPTDFERGARFAEAFGGVAALLRFPVA